MSEGIDTAVNGFGRIGMLYSRVAIDDPQLELLAINAGEDTHDTAIRLEFDSVHRNFGDHVITDHEDSISVDEATIAIYGFRDLDRASWREVSDRLIVIESTGSNLTRDEVAGHLNAGAKRVVITAPARDITIPTIVRGVNDTPDMLASIEDVVAVSSCSTNCIAPILKVLDSNFDVRWGIADTPHAYTNSQRALDGRGKDTASRRGLDSLLPASTGSAKEVIRLFPDLDFFRAESMRVPIADGSVAMLTIGINGKVQANDVAETIIAASEEAHKGIIGISQRGMYSERVLGQPFSSVIDPRQITIDKTGDTSVVKLQAWFDNEWGYANRVAEVAKLVGQLL
jgi:glyceraldehyde 3-phosphate dehydrogenase